MSSSTPPKLERRSIPAFPKQAGGLRSVPAWGVSLLFHVVVITAVGALWVAAPKGTGGEADRPMGVAVVYESAGQTDYYLTGAGNDGSDAEAADAELSEALPSASDGESEQLLDSVLPGKVDGGSDPQHGLQVRIVDMTTPLEQPRSAIEQFPHRRRFWKRLLFLTKDAAHGMEQLS